VARWHNICISSAALTDWYYFTRRERFYGDLMSPVAIKCT